MLCVWVQIMLLSIRDVIIIIIFFNVNLNSCDPWGVSDGSRLAVHQTLSSVLLLSFSGMIMCFVLLFLSFCRFFFFFAFNALVGAL